MPQQKPKRVSTFTTIQITRKTRKKIQRAKKESEYILSCAMIIEKAMDLFLKKDPKRIRWND